MPAGAYKHGRGFDGVLSPYFPPLPLDSWRRERLEPRCWLVGSQWGKDAYLVRAITLFFLGCWLTGLPMLPFFREPFRASSRCFSAGEYGKEAVSCPGAPRPCCLAGGLLWGFPFQLAESPQPSRHLMLTDMHLALHNLRLTVVGEERS